MQVTFPFIQGGLSFRRAFDVVLPGFIFSLLAVRPLVDAVLSHVSGLAQMGELTVAVLSWSSAHISVCEPEGLSRLSHKTWDVEAARMSFVNLLNSVDQVTRASLLAAATKEIRMWLHAVPVPSLGTQLDPESLWVAVALRVGASVYEWHKCRCGSVMESLGHHGLSCRFSAG